MGIPGPMQIVLIVFVILLLFGAKKLPALARSLGESLTEFKKAVRNSTKKRRQNPTNQKSPRPSLTIH